MAGMSRFDFYPRDWFLDTRDLSDRAKGLYIDLMAATYARGRPLDHDERSLLKFTGHRTVRSFRAPFQELLDTGKLKIVDGNVVNNRVQEEISKYETFRAQASKGGRHPKKLTSSAGVPPQYTGNSSGTPAERGSDFEQNQGVNPKLPSPSPSPSKKESKGFAFAGKVIRLTQQDLDAWLNLYHHVPNLLALLDIRDGWLVARPDPEQRRWWHTTKSWLVNKDAEYALGNPPDPNDKYWSDFEAGVIH
jgi:uncharacterized protein YdaU (DUF1376 family)